MLTDVQKQELSRQLKEKSYPFFEEFYPDAHAVRALIVEAPDLFVCSVWHEFGHTMIELADNNMWTCVAVIEGIHEPEEVCRICHPE